MEQDLVLSRLIVEIASHDLLGSELAFRGGTCLNKLHLPKPLRFSEDLDYVRRTRSGVGPFLDAIRDVATNVGLEEQSHDIAGQMVHTIFDAQPTSGEGQLRIRIEMNIREVESFEHRVALPYEVESPWWSGRAEVTTFTIEELMSTKFRALYQRRKGRDLFDLWHVLFDLRPDPERIVNGLHHYMGDQVFTYRELAGNLSDKLNHPDFAEDLDALVQDVPTGYQLDEAADLVMESLGSRLKNAPALEDIQESAWRN